MTKKKIFNKKATWKFVRVREPETGAKLFSWTEVDDDRTVGMLEVKGNRRTSTRRYMTQEHDQITFEVNNAQDSFCNK